MLTDYPPFPGFRDEAFAFLRALKQNNRRDWFKPRKATYTDEVQWPLRCLVVDAGRQASLRDLPLTGDPKAGLFRIYRDTRFSKNKQPYKTSAGAVLSRSGTRKDSGVVYIHVEPGASFLGAGFWRPDNDVLRRWRTHMAAHPTDFLVMVDALDAAGLTLEHGGQTLKRMPRGFTDREDTEIGDYLKWKSFTVSRPVADEAMQSPDFTDAVVQMMTDTLPLLEFGWQREPDDLAR